MNVKNSPEVYFITANYVLNVRYNYMKLELSIAHTVANIYTTL